jgi:hypothetical protein
VALCRHTGGEPYRPSLERLRVRKVIE